nr:hypothetical protein [Tanacetum cinerariifolium]
ERSDSLDDNIISRLPLFSASTPNEPDLSTEEPDNSLSMGDEHLETIMATESNQFIKYGVDNLIPIPKGDMLLFEAFLNDDHSFDFKTMSFSTSLNSPLEETNNFDNSLAEFTTFSNILFDAKYESDSSDDQSYEFAGELTLLKSIPSGVDETDCDFEEDIHLIENSLYDNSSPRPPEEFVFVNSDAAIESFSPSSILVKYNDSIMKEIDLFCTPDYPMPSGIVDKDYDSERDI